MSVPYRSTARFFWFGPDSLAEWKEYLLAGADRGEVHNHGNEATVSFFKAGEHLGTVNVSHVCPVDCP